MNAVGSRMMRVGAVAAAGLLAAALAGCASSQAPDGQEAASSPATAASPPASGAPPAGTVPAAVDGSVLGEHVHNLALQGEVLYLGTHEGLYRQVLGYAPELVSQKPFDVMGLSRMGSTWLASGHPANADGPANLGLITSTDDGVTWAPRSLSGDVDFHRLAAAGATIVGISAHDNALLRSDDEGESWVDLGVSPLFDVVISPADSSILIGTTGSGPVRSTDGGETFTPIRGGPLLAFLGWGTSELFGVTPDGTVYASADDGVTWVIRGQVPGQPAAFAVDDQRIAVLADGVVNYAFDGGVTFNPRIVNVGEG